MSFFTLLENDDVEGTREALTANPELVEITDEDGESPLYYAASNCDVEMIDLLISFKADINFVVKDQTFTTPLFASIRYQEDTKVAECLIKNGANLSAKNWHGRTPLHYSVTEGRVDFVELLIKSGADVNAVDCYGFTPLHLATDGEYECVKLLLANGAKVDIGERHNNKTSIYYAIEHGHLEIVRLLLDTHPGIANHNSTTNHDYTTKGLLKYTQTIPILHFAARRSKFEIVKLLVERGADINEGAGGDGTPLYFAVQQDDHLITQFLLEQGAKPNLTTSEGSSPMTYALIHRNKDNIRLMIQYGGDLNKPNKHGIKPKEFIECGKMEREIKEYQRLPRLKAKPKPTRFIERVDVKEPFEEFMRNRDEIKITQTAVGGIIG
jgi:ankyrin repeat protein